MEQEPFDLSQLFPNIAARCAAPWPISVCGRAAGPCQAARETGPGRWTPGPRCWTRAITGCCGLVNDLTAAGCLGQEEPPLPLRDRDLAETARGVCDLRPAGWRSCWGCGWSSAARGRLA